MSGSKDDSTNPMDEAEKAALEVDEIIENTEQGEGDIFDDLFNDIDDLVEELTEGDVGAEEDNPKEAAIDSDNAFDLENLQEIDADTYIEPVIEKKEWEPEPIPRSGEGTDGSQTLPLA